MEGRSRENAIAERTQPDDSDAAAEVEPLESIGLRVTRIVSYSSSIIHRCRFIDEHDRNLIANRVKPVAGHATEPAAIGFRFNFGPASRTNQDFEEFCADGHLLMKRLF